MKFKKIIVTMCLCSLLVNSITLTSNANNHSDTGFRFNFSYVNGVSQTEGRKKEDSSSSYIKAVELPTGGMEVRINGSHTLYQPTWYNVTKDTTAWINILNQGRAIRQYVYERGYSYAQLEGRRRGQTEDATGVWSPDSTGTYPALN